MASSIASDCVSLRKASMSGRAAKVVFKTIVVWIVVIPGLQGLRIIYSETTGPSLHRQPSLLSWPW